MKCSSVRIHPIPGVGDREAVLTQQPLIDLDLALVSVMPFFVERFGGEVVDRRERAEGVR